MEGERGGEGEARGASLGWRSSGPIYIASCSSREESSRMRRKMKKEGREGEGTQGAAKKNNNKGTRETWLLGESSYRERRRSALETIYTLKKTDRV